MKRERARTDDCGEALRGGRTLTGESLIHKIVIFYMNFVVQQGERWRGGAETVTVFISFPISLVNHDKSIFQL